MTPPKKQRRQRLRPEQRRHEILSTAARIALEDGLERITLRGVAERLGVRPGLIGHYFPNSETLVAQAFEMAMEIERGYLFPVNQSANPLRVLRAYVVRAESRRAVPSARLRLNARHLSRYSAVLREALCRQENKDIQIIEGLIEAAL